MEPVFQDQLARIPNFYRITDYFFRGGQPSKEQLSELHKAGIKTVVNLRSKSQNIDSEKLYAREIGLNYFGVPLIYWRAPLLSEIERVVDIVEDPGYQPVFIHCLHGADRTGFVVAMYRVICCQWDFEEAYSEMVACGFHKIRVYHYKRALRLLTSKVKNSGIDKNG